MLINSMMGSYGKKKSRSNTNLKSTKLYYITNSGTPYTSKVILSTAMIAAGLFPILDASKKSNSWDTSNQHGFPSSYHPYSTYLRYSWIVGGAVGGGGGLWRYLLHVSPYQTIDTNNGEDAVIFNADTDFYFDKVNLKMFRNQRDIKEDKMSDLEIFYANDRQKTIDNIRKWDAIEPEGPNADKKDRTHTIGVFYLEIPLTVDNIGEIGGVKITPVYK